MELIIPDILSDARELTPSLLATGLAAGVVLWFAGWWTHRFWMVLGLTVLGGIWGLQNAATVSAQPFVAAIGVGLAAGILALTLVRLGAFVAGGYAGMAFMHAAFPAWEQPLVSFLAGGLLGFALLRYWMMALTSLAGIVLAGHAGLAWLDKAGKLDSVKWSEINANVLTTTCGAVALAGFVLQLVLDSRIRGREAESKASKKDGKKPKYDSVEALQGWRRAG